MSKNLVFWYFLKIEVAKLPNTWAFLKKRILSSKIDPLWISSERRFLSPSRLSISEGAGEEEERRNGCDGVCIAGGFHFAN